MLDTTKRLPLSSPLAEETVLYAATGKEPPVLVTTPPFSQLALEDEVRRA